MLKRAPTFHAIWLAEWTIRLAHAIYLGSSMYRIHGSNEPDTIGAAVSSGCIRMTNRDVVDLSAWARKPSCFGNIVWK
jgi:lipoprotein-anchoring transpeptidase ErfK/SrfK